MAAFIEKMKRFCGGSAPLAALLAVNIAIGIILSVAGMVISMRHGDVLLLPRLLALSADFGILMHHPWTLLTYMVTHFSLLHLLFNMLWLYWFGRMMLLCASDRALLRTYIGGGVSGGVLYAIVSIFAIAPQGAYLCGASASVLAMMAFSMLRMPDYRIRLMLFGEVKLKWFAFVCIILTFLGVGGGSSGGPVAHLGGLAYGLGAGLLYGRKGFFGLNAKIKEYLDGVKSRNSDRRRRQAVRDGAAVALASAGRLSDHVRLDELLDKIRISGYASLSASERRELDAISSRLRDK